MDRIVFVDDEPPILNSLKRSLMDEPYETVFHEAPERALEDLRERPAAVVVSDQRMPSMDGVAFLGEVKRKWPDTVRILLTGHASLETALSSINQGSVYQFLEKPWDEARLKRTLHNALDHRRMRLENRRLLELTREQNDELSRFNKHLERLVEERTQEVLQLNESLHRSFYEMIRAFVEMMELFDPSLVGHCKRTTAMAKRLGRALKWGEDRLKRLKTAALLHDVGQIGLPRGLFKRREDELDDAERRLLWQHPALGYSMLNKVEELAEVAGIVKCHHEAIDGSGYPERLEGGRVPLESQIIHLCSLYDHLVHDRRHSPLKALEALRWKKNGFHPSVFNALADGVSRGIEAKDDDLRVRALKGLDDLRPGMVLARDVWTVRGRLLLSEGTKVHPTQIRKLKVFDELDPIRGMICIVDKRK